MSTDNQGSQQKLVVVTQEENPSFIRKSGELSKLLKGLTKASEEALEILQTIMATTKDEKLKVECVKALIGFQIQTAKQVNDDNMQRMIAEIKLNRQPIAKRLSVSDPDDDKEPLLTPVLDFGTIREF